MSKPEHPSIFRPLEADRQEIRLVRIKPSSISDAKIECELVSVYLQTQPRLEALSYFWGDPNITAPILLNGVEWQVPANLEPALRRLRHEDRERLIWIDSLCINQADADERVSQIGLMHQIYRGPTQVVVWLGDCDAEDQDAGLQMLEYLSSGTQWIELFPNLDDMRGATNDTSKCVEGLSMIEGEYLEPPIDQMSELLESPWWERLWTLQEVVLAQKIRFQWGGRIFDWPLLERADIAIRTEAASNAAELAFLFDDFENFLWLISSRVREIRHLKTQQERLWRSACTVDEEWIFLTFASTLNRCRYRDSTDRRDKVFGLLGLFPESVRSAVKPSYQDSVREIFVRTAFLILHKTNSFFMFNHVAVYDEFRLELPSWVPSWTSSSQYEEDDEFRIAQRHVLSASGQSRFSANMDTDGVLRVSAIRVDKISATLGLVLQVEDPLRFRDHIDHQWDNALQEWNEANKGILGSNDEILMDLIIPILINGCAPGITNSELKRADAQDMLDVERWMESYPNGPAANEEHTERTFMNHPSSTIFKTCQISNRREGAFRYRAGVCWHYVWGEFT